MTNTFRLATVALILLTTSAYAQRPRTTAQDANDPSVNMPTPPTAPATVTAKYEGGVFGYNKKMTGTINFDDANQRLVFRDTKGSELFPIPYKAITGAFGDTHSVQPAAATVASHVPYVGLPASLIKTKVKYLTIQYSDPDSKVAGVTSFRIENKDLLDSVLYTLATKSGLSRRGEIYVRKNP